MRKWKRKLLASHGLVIAGEKITNIRYADDLMLYARSLQDLKDMTELLITELGAMGLQLNASKTRFVHGTCTRWMLDRRAHAVPFWVKPWPPPVFSSPTIQWEMWETTGRGAGAGEDDDEKGLERLKPL